MFKFFRRKPPTQAATGRRFSELCLKTGYWRSQLGPGTGGGGRIGWLFDTPEAAERAGWNPPAT